MNRTENFIALAAIAVVTDTTKPEGWMLLLYVGMAAFLFVRWFNLARSDAPRLDA